MKRYNIIYQSGRDKYTIEASVNAESAFKAISTFMRRVSQAEKMAPGSQRYLMNKHLRAIPAKKGRTVAQRMGRKG